MKLKASRLTAGLVVATLIAVGLVAAQPPQSAEALDGSQFNPGLIIGDTKFYDANAMTQAEIQTFLEAVQLGTCGNSNCLKLLRMDTVDKAQYYSSSSGQVECQPYPGARGELASTIIFKVQQICGISAKVILVTMQKEQGLILKLSPTTDTLRRAMGMGCPDTTGGVCAAEYDGFFNQVYWGARQMKTYRAAPTYFNFRAGRTSNIQYHPNTACGTQSVYVANHATAALYNYTPYVPNAVALANLSVTGDGCSSYGNRNFWVFYNNWFGSPVGDPSGAFQTVTVSNNAVTVTGWAADPDVSTAAINVRVRGAGWSRVITANKENAASGSAFNGAGTLHGFSETLYASVGTQQICVDALNQPPGSDVTIGCARADVPTSIQTPRIEGTDRYSTAVKISSQNFAPGVAVAYVALGENFPDALSAAPAAASQSAPLLLVSGTTAAPSIIDELKRLAPQKIVVVGGTAAIPETVALQFAAIAPVERISGADRYQTSIRVGEVLGAAKRGRAYIATGSNFPDAISAASAAGFQDAPLLLINGTSPTVPPAIADALARWGVTQVTVIGGNQAISDGLLAAIEALPNITATRISGVDRYSTSIAVNRGAAFGTFGGGYVATGTTFADGLTGGAVAGRDGKPLYLTPASCVPQDVITDLHTASATSLTLLGGLQALGSGTAALSPC